MSYADGCPHALSIDARSDPSTDPSPFPSAGQFETASAKIADPVPPALVACKLTVKLPEFVVVPEISPLEVETVQPVGKPVAPKLVGLFVAVI